MPLIAGEFALIDDPILTMHHRAEAVTLVSAPHPSVCRVVIRPVHCSYAFAKAILHLSLVASTVCPLEDTDSADTVLVPLALVGRAIGPSHFTDSLPHVCYPLAFVDQSIARHNAPMAVALIVFELPRV